MRSDILYSIVGGFAGGVLLRSFLDLGFAFTIFLFVTAAALLLLWAGMRQRSVLVVFLIILSATLGVFRFSVSEAGLSDKNLDARIGSHISIEGVVSDEADQREGHTNLTVSVRAIETEDGRLPADARMRVVAERYPAFTYGDVVAIEGELLAPDNFIDEVTGREVDYVGYLAKEGIAYQMFYPEIERVARGAGNPVRGALFAFKQTFLAQLSRILPEPEASLAGGIVVGAKRSLGEKLLQDFRDTGIIHIVVLSGYNVTIVAESLMHFFSFLPYAASLATGALSIIAFAVMTGAGATVVRASIMALLVVVARATGRMYAIKRALFVAGFLMLVHNPYVLVFDTSFQLSFIATLGLIYFAPAVERWLGIAPKTFGLREIAAATVATQIFVLPMLLYKMGAVSLVSLPVNLLVLVSVPAAMLASFLAGVVSLLGTVVALPFSVAAHLLLSYMLLVVEWFAQIPLAAVTVGGVPLWVALALYAGIAYVTWCFASGAEPRYTGTVRGVRDTFG